MRYTVCLIGSAGASVFPSMGSDDPPLGVENVKIRENSEKKNQGTPTGHLRVPRGSLNFFEFSHFDTQGKRGWGRQILY